MPAPVPPAAHKGHHKRLAVIDPDCCTGCEACIEVCPVDCIALHTRNLGVKGVEAWCEVDLERCVGCELCVHIPYPKSGLHKVPVCPWDAIEMVPLKRVTQVVAQIGGPADCLGEIRARLLGSAQRLTAQAGKPPRRH